jgi:hypothetical protein
MVGSGANSSKRPLVTTRIGSPLFRNLRYLLRHIQLTAHAWFAYSDSPVSCAATVEVKRAAFLCSINQHVIKAYEGVEVWLHTNFIFVFDGGKTVSFKL